MAVLWAFSFARAVGAGASAADFAVLGIGTWLLYVADRLLDGMAGPARSDLRERHFFHLRHRQALLAASVPACGALIWLIAARMHAALRVEDAWIFAGAALYFAAVHQRLARLRFPRELAVGIVFACACVAPAWAQAPYAHGDLAVLALLLAALAWLNCTAIHAWERSGPGRWPVVTAAALALALAAGLFLGMAVRNSGEVKLAAAILASALLLLALDRDFRRARKRADAPSPLAMRILADAALLTPLLLLVPWPK